MKKIFSSVSALLVLTSICYSQANTKLSNLVSPTAVNVNLVAGGATGTKDLGSNTKRWRNGYFNATVYGYGVGSSYGVYGTAGTYGVYGYSSNNGYGVLGTSGYIGVYGSGSSYGLYGSGGTYGAYGNGSSYGMYGYSSGGYGVAGVSSSSYGLYGSSSSSWGSVAYGVYGAYGNGTTGYGVQGVSSSSYGVYGSSGYLGVYGFGTTYGVYGGGGTYGVYGYTGVSGGQGLHAYSSSGNGVYGETGNNTSYWAGFFVGDVYSSTGVFTGSDARIKQNVRDLGSAMDIINGLHPKQYEFRNDGSYKSMNFGSGTHFGLVAQDLEKVLPNLVKTSELKKPVVAKADAKENNTQEETVIKDFKAVNYTELIPILVKAMQELSKQNDDLKTKVATLTQTMSDFNKTSPSISTSGASLNQNFPNPFTKSTVISYAIPQGSNGSIMVSQTGSGKVVKTVILSSGASQLTFDASSLSPGSYTYSLIIDGKKIDSKQMVVN